MRWCRLLLSCVTLLSLSRHVHAYGTGAPAGACITLKPGHSESPQTSTTPYTITFTPASYTPSSTVTVTITDTTGAKFKGFIIQARRADPTLDQNTAIGTFTVDSSGTLSQTSCSGNALTHTQFLSTTGSSPGTTSLTFTWTAPSSAQGHLYFRGAVAREKGTYWTNQQSAMLNDPTAGALGTTTPAPATTPPPSTTTGIDLAECGVSKGCMRSPTDCTDCHAVATWKDLNNGNVQIELDRRGTGWVAMGLSSDTSMGDDSVMACIRSGSSIAVTQAKNIGNSNTPISNPSDGISNVVVGYINGRTVCRFQRQKQVAGRATDIFDISQNYHYLLGYGTASSAAQAGINKHDTTPIASKSKQNAGQNINIGGSVVLDVAVKAHGSLMVISWVMTASFGVLMARHYKQQWPGKQIAGKDVWFMLHVPAMLITAIFTIIAFIVIFVHVQGYSDISGLAILKAHPVLGIIVTALAVINPIMGILRPHPGTSKRPLFNWAHWGVGVLARILGVITIFLGINLPQVKAATNENTTWVMVGFVAFYILVEILLELYKCTVGKRQSESAFELKSPGDPASGASGGHDSGQGFRNFMFALIVIGLLAFGLCIVILIAK